MTGTCIAIGACVFLAIWSPGFVVALIFNAERREDEYGNRSPVTARDLICVLLGWVYVVALLVRGSRRMLRVRGVRWSLKDVIAAVRRGW